MNSLGQDWKQIGQTIYGEAENDNSGESIATNNSGSRIAIGTGSNDGNGDRSGHVRVFEDSLGTWVQLGNDLDGEAKFDYSGEDVTMNYSGSIVAIGAGHNDGGDDNGGHVRVYEYKNNAWVQLGADLDGNSYEDFFGDGIALDSVGHRIAVGAPSWDGEVRVYDFDGSNWNQIGINLEGNTWQDEFGYDVSLSNSGTRLAVSAPGEDSTAINCGMVRMYDLVDSNWVQVGQDIYGEAKDDKSGRSIDLNSNGDRIAIGTPGNDGNGSGTGQVRVFEYNTDSAKWLQVGADIDGEANYNDFGNVISISGDGNHIIAGAERNSDGGYNAGHARVFELKGGVWTKIASDIDGESFDRKGAAVAISQDAKRIFVSATSNKVGLSQAGQVHAFELANCTTEFTSVDSVLTSSNDSIISNSADTLSRFQWLDCGNSFTPIPLDTTKYFTPSSAGHYAVQISRYGCVDTSNCYSYMLTGTDFTNKVVEYTLSPNPSVNDVLIQGSTDFEYAQVIDSRGLVVLTSKARKLDTSLLKSGMYFVTVFNEKGEPVTTLKMVKK